MNLLDLPTVVLLEIFEFLSYDDISKNRAVCRRFDQVCQHVLNAGFNRVVRLHATRFKRIKSLLPRRESERRNHWLARHADILTSIETRISMLSMTYSKRCFIPGRVLDEIMRILHLIASTQKPLRPHEVLQELRDISSMAIEHFDEKIAPTLKKTSIIDHPCRSMGSGCLTGANMNITQMGIDTMAGRVNVVGLGTNRYTTSDLSNVVGSFGGSGSSSSGSGSGSGGLLSSIATPVVPTSSGQQCSCNINTILEDTNSMVTRTLRLGGPHSCNPCTATGHAPNANSNAQQNQSHETGVCQRAQVMLLTARKLELEQKKLQVKMQRMHQIQLHQSRRLQQALNIIGEQTTQIVELKKRLEDVDAKNREISANIKQINNGDQPTSVVITSVSKTDNTDINDVVQPIAQCSNKLSIDSIKVAASKRRCTNDNENESIQQCEQLIENDVVVTPAKKQKL